MTLLLGRPDLGIEPIRLGGTIAPDGTWRMDPLPDLPRGEWQVTLDLRITDFQLVRLRGTVVLD
ncbi:MAG: hypothetical protein EON59_07705 [Alphaproteobacteria bacterium]|nr:MAG: hypothetical protein EON59_07705 [Alphaproteobacteria bacterium]